MTTRVGIRISGYTALIIMSVVSVLPLAWVWLQSLRTPADIATNPIGFSWPPAFSNYTAAWTQARFSDYLLNSAIVAIGTVVIVLVVSLPAAYALANLRLPASTPLLSVFLLGLMIPVWSVIIPLFFQMKSLGLVDTLIGAIVVESALGIPFGVFLLRAFLLEVPIELLEAARIDGAGNLRTLWSIVRPISTPGLQALAVFQFMWSWNELAVPLFFLQTESVRTLPIGLTFFQGRFSTDTAVLAAGTTLASLPVLIVYLILNRRFIQGLTAGATK